MGGMAPASRYHTGVNSLVSYVMGQPTNLWTSCWHRTVLKHSYFLFQACVKMKQVSSSIVYLLVSRLHKNETILEHSSLSMSSSLKNEIDVLKHSYFMFQACVKMKQVTLSSVYSWFQAH